ncbi:EVE domain-containing protein [Weeksellaceae bacterium KMM 9724]|uniref:AAA family ATPase n=1 Tax=Profundicola chukchiensis TaxID=2961959 RepID=UPI002439E980|nr:AAA family ATPase [Profundicola chukchiensis]MDG4950944.1 EVE domain-containing protein [Profundicola chukchiensis]
MLEEDFSWIQTHIELTEYLKTKENSQKELIELLKSVGVSPFNDQSIKGVNDIELSEIDPFTFFCYIYKYGTKKRLKILQKIAKELDLSYPLGEKGIPSAQPQKVRLFPYKYHRNDEVQRLWDLFYKELDGKVTNEEFQDIWDIKGVGKTKLTEALFYINPKNNLPINGPVKSYLKVVLDIDPNFSNYTEYKTILEKVRSITDTPFHEISFKSWEWNNNQKKTNYWVFQGNPRIFDIEKALKDEILTDWTVSAHKDKIKAGDKVILWITGNKPGIYALAEVTSEASLKSTTTDDHLWKEEDRNELKAGIKITHNLVENPISKDETENIEELTDLKVGLQGTNFSATEEQYEEILNLISNKGTNSFDKIKNQIEPTIFNNYIKYLRLLLSELEIQPNDQRVVFSIQNESLNFIVGQRYCFNLSPKNSKGLYFVMTKEKLRDNSFPFDGTAPQPFYTYLDEFSPNDDEWNNVLTASEEGLLKTKKSGFLKYNNQDFENFVFAMENQKQPQLHKMNFPLNSILYGPPGTGKTYTTILKAASIIENREITSYDEALEIFNANLHKRIEFVTFHQNYSYEDFIQGLRPDTEDDKRLTFEKKDGVFKRIADLALKNLDESNKPAIEIEKHKAFEDALELLKDKVIESEATRTPVKLNETAYFTAVEDDAFRYSADNWTLNDKGFDGFRMKYSDLIRFFEEGVTERKQIKHIKNISGLAKQHATYFIKAYELIKSLLPQTHVKTEKVSRKNYVIIIDEINRANISRVFGELITLIEPDKRSEGSIPLSATLPSGDTFMVPSNLYIIGTMNTADKSIALLDIALRRRFEFIPMYPKYNEDGVEVKDEEILRSINDLIIKEKGHDFQIGHSYFMDSNEDPYDLEKRMNLKVIPLMLEYFMNDFKAVAQILNSALSNTEYHIDTKLWPLKLSKVND